MKKVFLFITLSFASVALRAHLSDTKWMGVMQLKNKIDVVFDYRKDTLEVSNIADNSNIETMTYTVKDSVVTFKKIYGQSNCDATEGKYRFEVKDESLYITLISDTCSDRSAVLGNSTWMKMK